MNRKRNIIISITLLGLISIINLYNAKYLNHFYSYYYLKQLIWYILSFLICYIMSKNKIKTIFKYSNYIYYFNLVLLILVLLLGKNINGSKAWLNLGIFSFQPSEFMKISLNLYLFNICDQKCKKKIKLLRLIMATIIPSILVFLEPDTGAIIFYIIIFLISLSYLKIDKKYYILFFLTGIISFGLIIYLYIFKQNILIKILGTSIFYRADRIINFKANNYQRDLAMLSIFGSNIMQNGFQKILIYVPESPTDFIFAFSTGNYGILLGITILIFYFFLLNNLLGLIKIKQDKKTNYLIISFVYMTFLQIIINISMNIGIIPIIGITLPFLSYGGSSLLICFIYLGMIFSLTNKDD